MDRISIVTGVKINASLARRFKRVQFLGANVEVSFIVSLRAFSFPLVLSSFVFFALRKENWKGDKPLGVIFAHKAMSRLRMRYWETGDFLDQDVAGGLAH